MAIIKDRPTFKVGHKYLSADDKIIKVISRTNKQIKYTIEIFENGKIHTGNIHICHVSPYSDTLECTNYHGYVSATEDITNLEK